MLSEFIIRKLQTARYKILKDGTYFGEVPSFQGVWANANNLEDCRTELRDILEEWMLLKVKSGDKIPGFKLKMDRRELVKHA
jgi:predicted RNase H-like HicB family nuclease